MTNYQKLKESADISSASFLNKTRWRLNLALAIATFRGYFKIFWFCKGACQNETFFQIIRRAFKKISIFHLINKIIQRKYVLTFLCLKHGLLFPFAKYEMYTICHVFINQIKYTVKKKIIFHSYS